MTEKLDDTLYEFKDNDDASESRDDIDDFERRLNGGKPQQRAPAPVKEAATAPSAATRQKPVLPRSGKDYVKAARPTGRATDAEDDFEDGKKAVRDLDKFDRLHAEDDDD